VAGAPGARCANSPNSQTPLYKNRRSLGFDRAATHRARDPVNFRASFGIKGRKTGKIFGPGLDFRILKAYITRKLLRFEMQELLERRKDEHGLNTWIIDTYQMGYNSHGPIFCGVIDVLNSLKLPNSQ